MTKRGTKHSLLMSALALLLCVSMLIGTTFAWFTDSVTSTGNIIKSGTLNVGMYWADGTKAVPTDVAAWNDASEGAIFEYDKWEPGFTQVRHIKIANEGTLALKYNVTITAYDENGVALAPEDAGILSDVIDVYYIDPATQIVNRTDLANLPDENKLGTLKTVLGNLNTSANGKLLEKESDTVTLALKMQESAGNEYQDKSIGASFAVTLFATQLESEKDSFDETYDAAAEYPATNSVYVKEGESATIKVNDIKTTIPTATAATEGTYSLEVTNKEVTTDANGVSTVSFDITLYKDGKAIDTPNGIDYPVEIYVGSFLNISEVTHKGNAVSPISYDEITGYVSFTTDSFSPFAVTYAPAESVSCTIESEIAVDKPVTIPEGTSVVLNLGDAGKLVADYHKSAGAVITNNGNLTIVGGTLSSIADNGGSAIVNNGTLTVKDATLNGAPNANGSWPAYTVNNTGVMEINNCDVTSTHGAIASYGEGAVVTLNNVNIAMTGIPGFTSHALYTYNGGAIIVNGGNIVNAATDQSATGGSAINGNVTVLNGTFSGRLENYYGTPVIKGGTFSANPSGFLAKGYTAKDNGDGTWTVEVTLVDASTGITSTELASGKPITVTEDTKLTSYIANDATIELANNTLTVEKTIELKNGSDLTLTNGSYYAEKSSGHIDVRPSGGESVVLIENVDFVRNYVSHTGSSSNATSTVMELCSVSEDGTATVTFKNCTFTNASVLLEGLSSVVGVYDVTFDGCVFNCTGNSEAIEIKNYVNAKLTVKNCTFNMYTTSNVSAIDISPSTSTTATVVLENNTVYGEVADSSIYNLFSTQSVKVINSYSNATVTETGTVKTGITK